MTLQSGQIIHFILLMCIPFNNIDQVRSIKHHHHVHNNENSEENAMKRGTTSTGITQHQKRGKVAALPTLSAVVASESGVVFEIKGCKMALTKDQCQISLIPSKETCGGKIPLNYLLEHFYPKNKIAEETKTFLLPDKFDLKKLKINHCENTIEFETVAREKIEIISDKLSVDSAALSVSFNYRTGTMDWETIAVDINGILSIFGKSIKCTLKKKTKETELKFSFSTDQLTIPNFTKMFTEKQVTSADGDKDVTEAVGGLTIKNPTVSGLYDPKGFYEFVLKGEPSGEKFKSALFYAIVQKPPEGDVKVALVGSFKELSPLKILSAITGKDLGNIPLIKDAVVNFALEVASDSFMIIKNEDLSKALSSFISSGKTICKGMKLKFDLPVLQLLKKAVPDIKTDGLPTSLFLKVFIDADGLTFKFPDTWKSDLLKILQAFAPKVKQILPEWFQSSMPAVEVNAFSFDYKTMALKIDISAPGPFKLGKILTLSNVALTVSHKDEDSPWEFSFSSTQSLFGGSTTMSTSLAKKGENNYEFIGTIDYLSTIQLVEYLGAKFANEETMKKLKFLDFGIRDLKIVATFGGSSSVRISGSGILFGWDGVQIEGVLFYQNDSPAMALGIQLKQIRMDEIVKKLFDKELLRSTWLTNMDVGIVLSNTDVNKDLKKLAFTLPTLAAMPIKKGMFIQAEFTIPEDCKKDGLCLQAQTIAKDDKKKTSFLLQGTITTSGLEIRAIYKGEWILGPNVNIPETSLVIKVGAVTELYFEIKVNVVKPKLELKGKLGIGVTGMVEVNGKMIGIWEKPFGMKYLAFGNINLGVKFQPGIPVVGVEYEGDLRLGKIGSGKELIIKTAMGIDPIPIKSYFYGSINKFTIQGIADAFDFTTSLPEVLTNTGFPDGVAASFSPTGTKLPLSNRQLPRGFSVTGTINLFGLKAECDILIDLKNQISVKVKLPPMKIAKGLIEIKRSKDDSKNGPMFYGKVSPKAVAIELRGYIGILGISSEVVIDISEKGFLFHISGNLFNVITADLTVESKSKSKDIDQASFKVKACLSVAPNDLVTDAVKGVVKEAADEADITLKAAKTKVDGIGSLYDKAEKGITKWDKEVKEFHQKMNKKSKNMEESKAILKEKCLASCPQECVGGPDWNPKCIQVQGGWVGCPSWNDCKLKVPDQACLAKCKGKKTFGKLKAKVKQAALKVLMKILEGIKKLFSLGKSFFDKSKKLIDSAAVLYGKVTEKVKAGVDAAKEIAKHAIGNIIKIESMCFTSSLESAATSACVEFNINATILKTRKLDFFAKGCLDVSFAKTIGKAVADKLYPGINMVKSGLDGVKKMFAKIDSDKAEVETSMANADMEAKRDDDSDDNGKAAKRHIVWTTEELYFKKLAYEELPRFTLKDSETMAAFEENSPAIKILNSNPMERAIIQPISLHMKLDASFKRDSISNKSLLTPEKTSSGSCQELSNVVRSYSNISGGLSELTDSVKKQHQQFEVSTKRRRSIIHKLAKRIRIVCSHNKCTEDDLENAIFFTRKAHDGILSWADNVRTKLKEQDAVTLDVWKKTLILNLKSSKDIGLNEYLDKLNNVGVNAYDRMEIPKADTAGNIPKLNMISSTLKELLNNSDKVPLSEAVPLIERLGAQVKDIRGSFSQACDTSSHPDDVRVL